MRLTIASSNTLTVFIATAKRTCAMQRHLISLNACVMLLMIPLAYAGHKCVWVHGTVRCHKDPSKNLNVEVRVYDRDGLSIAKIIDPDDLMGEDAPLLAVDVQIMWELNWWRLSSTLRVTFTNEDGSFQLDGCGGDIDWIPGISNYPEPYLQLLHYCNSQTGEIIRLPPFKIFVPKTYEIGTIDLDLPIQVSFTGNDTIDTMFSCRIGTLASLSSLQISVNEKGQNQEKILEGLGSSFILATLLKLLVVATVSLVKTL
ncbi:unnamed protein product [Litomosoides sigmodontis]|uniref:Uncharacterized protein n=1 Tax=Litomosoides sigmodontis TaxID=42156 RepID=A0A3P6SVZ5_LITSI|nr:unnamed protein product [Litomosoides sigmodontis]VDK79992.1 unnamed protein product [Litomosoides sigmodontis]